jgi:hypothetical protein
LAGWEGLGGVVGEGRWRYCLVWFTFWLNFQIGHRLTVLWVVVVCLECVDLTTMLDGHLVGHWDWRRECGMMYSEKNNIIHILQRW